MEGGQVLMLGGHTLRLLVPKGRPSEKLKLRIVSTLWLMLQEAEKESCHGLNWQKNEATSP
jgi:hypothetical protein